MSVTLIDKKEQMWTLTSHMRQRYGNCSSVYPKFLAKQTAQQYQLLELMCLVEVSSGANVQLQILDDANLKAYLEANLTGIGIISMAHQLKQDTGPEGPKVFESYIASLKGM